MTLVHLAFIVCRFFQDITGSLLWGIIFYLTIGVRSPELRGHIMAKLRVLLGLLGGILGIATLCYLPIMTAMIGSGWHDAYSRQMLWAVLSETSAGYSWGMSLCGCLILFSCLWIKSYCRFIALFGAAVMLASLSITGHTRLEEGWIGLCHQLNDVLHVIAGASWIGGLIPLLLIIMLVPEKEQDWFDILKAVHCFSKLGMFSVGIIILTGLTNTLFILGRVPIHWHNTYQFLLDGKVLLVFVMILLAIRNKIFFTPRLNQSHLRHQVILQLRMAVILELVLGGCVIALVAVFGSLDPHAMSM